MLAIDIPIALLAGQAYQPFGFRLSELEILP